MLLLGVEKVRTGARQSFADTDLGHRSRGRRAQRVTPAAALLRVPHRQRHQQRHLEELSGHQLSRPMSTGWFRLSLGDSHRGFRVLGTTPEYFSALPVSRQPAAGLRGGRAISMTCSMSSLGADVASRLGYNVGDKIVVGARRWQRRPSSTTTTSHSACRAFWPRPARRSTSTLHVSLEAIEAIHVDWQTGVHGYPGEIMSADRSRARCSSRRRR